MYRLATCNDLITLKSKYKDYWFPEGGVGGGRQWGLKQMGYLFVVDNFFSLEPRRVLEAGAGTTRFIGRHFGHKLEYWGIDKADYHPDPEGYREIIKKRKNTTWVEDLLGNFSKELPDNYFDMVFSVSVIEHIPVEVYENFCKDMFRVLKPGGLAIHSFDVNPNLCRTRGKRFYDTLKKTGFDPGEAFSPNWDIRDPDNQLLLESLGVVYTNYGGQKEDMWENIKEFKYFHFGTLLINARKPGETHKE